MTDDVRLMYLGFRAARPDGCAADADDLLGMLRMGVPLDYARFLRRYGGGRFEAEVEVRCTSVPPVSQDGLALFGEFFRVGSGSSSLREVWARSGELLEEGLVPVASAAGGDLYCLRSQPQSVDVVLWDHDSGLAYAAASSFENFLERLVPGTARSSADMGKIRVKLDPERTRSRRGG